MNSIDSRQRRYAASQAQQEKSAILSLIALLVVAALVGGAGFGILWVLTLNARTEAACAALGYPNAKVTWTFTRYCIKRVDQTDTIVPLSSIQK